MQFTKTILIALALVMGCAHASETPETSSIGTPDETDDRELSYKSKYKKHHDKKPKKRNFKRRASRLKITNLTYRQIFSPFFYMVHDCDTTLYTLGMPASDAIKELAEDGSSTELLKVYDPTTRDDVCMAGVTKGPVPPGGSINLKLRRSGKCECISIASMAIVTNDCFVSVNGEKLFFGDDNFYPGLDSGTEANTEMCVDIPGCGEENTNDNPTDGAEGFVHVHRGIEQKAELDGSFQWLNPMMRVQVV